MLATSEHLFSQRVRARIPYGSYHAREQVRLPGAGVCDFVLYRRNRAVFIIEVKTRAARAGIGQLLAYGHAIDGEPGLILAIPEALRTDALHAVCEAAGVQMWSLGEERSEEQPDHWGIEYAPLDECFAVVLGQAYQRSHERLAENWRRFIAEIEGGDPDLDVRDLATQLAAGLAA